MKVRTYLLYIFGLKCSLHPQIHCKRCPRRHLLKSIRFNCVTLYIIWTGRDNKANHYEKSNVKLSLTINSFLKKNNNETQRTKSFSLSESHIITNYIYLNLLLQVLIGLALAGVAAAENTPRYGYSPPPSPPSRTHPPKLTGSSSSSSSTSSLTTTSRRRLVRLQSQRQ